MKLKTPFRIFFIVISALLIAVNINTFIFTAGLLPGGFSGIVLLVQEVILKFCGVKIPYSVFFWLLNVTPAVICFKYVGKKFTIYSILMIILSGFFTDLVPAIKLTEDILLCAIFGGIFNGFAVCLCLSVGASTGGTDLISIYVAEKTSRSAWNYIFFGNVCVLVIFGLLFGWERALYSIIFQFVSTQIINMLYKRYQKSTLLIITDHVDDIYRIVKETTNHDATVFTGIGCFKGQERKLLYTVVGSDEVSVVVKKVRDEDTNAFVNVLQSKDLHGRFFMRKND